MILRWDTMKNIYLIFLNKFSNQKTIAPTGLPDSNILFSTKVLPLPVRSGGPTGFYILLIHK